MKITLKKAKKKIKKYQDIIKEIEKYPDFKKGTVVELINNEGMDAATGSKGIVTKKPCYFKGKHGNEGICIDIKWNKDIQSERGGKSGQWNGMYFVKDFKLCLPEYVKLIRGWSAGGEFMGEVFELATLDNLSKFKYAPSKEVFKASIYKWIGEGHFEISTKEAYDAQHNQELTWEDVKEAIDNNSQIKKLILDAKNKS